MLVSDVMQGAVLTITPKTTLPEALRLVQHRGIRHLPVVEDDKLVGIVSDRDLKRAMASPATSLERHELRYLLDTVTVDEIMAVRVCPARCSEAWPRRFCVARAVASWLSRCTCRHRPKEAGSRLTTSSRASSASSAALQARTT